MSSSREVFISYAHDDRAIADKVCAMLEQDGVACWIAPRDMSAGDFGEQIIDAIESTRVMVLILSAHANASTFVKNEVAQAVDAGRVVIPLRIEEVKPARDLKIFIARAHWIDAWTPPLEARVHILAAAIRRLLLLPPPQEAQPKPRPPTPVEPTTPTLWRRIGRAARRFRSPRLAAVALLGLALVLAAGALLLGWRLTDFKGGTVTATLSPSISAIASVPAHQAFSGTGSMGAARESPSATILSDGRVLLVGGTPTCSASGCAGLASAELYDPKAGTFSRVGSMNDARWDHTATLLSDGRVLVAGGRDGSTVLASAELYDPKTRSFSATGAMTTGRGSHTATLLSDGHVLIAGGSSSGQPSLASAELYDPKAGTFSPVGSMTDGRWDQTATLLSDGHVLIAGGWDRNEHVLASAELYDSTSGTFGPTGSMAVARTYHTATLLPDGRVLIVGGYAGGNATTASSAELFDPTARSFSPTGSMGAGRGSHTATLLHDGNVLISGGDDGPTELRSADLYTSATGTFNATGPLTTARAGHTATPLPDGRVLIAGGRGEGNRALASAELFQP